MDFKDKITQLSEKIRKQADSIQTEEATKNSFIMPMLIALGYDVFDPSEVVPELDCDIARNKGDKIDYAIMRDGEPAILVECKHCKQNLDLHDTQLKKYYVASKARFGVLTNGIEYRFYTDLDRANIMDERPFMVLDLLNMSDHDIEQLKKFHKSYFNESDILSTAQQLQISLAIRGVINREFQNPSAGFVRYFVKETNNGYYGAKQVEQYTPLVKKEIGNYINDVISDRLNVAIKNTPPEEPSSEVIAEDACASGVETTQDELDAYNIVRSILRKDVDVSRIGFSDYKSYAVVWFDEQWKWIVRFRFGRKLQLAFPCLGNPSNEERVELQSIDDIFNHSEKLVESLKRLFK